MAKAGSQLATASFYMYDSCQRSQAYLDGDWRSTLRKGRAMNNVTNHKRFTASLVRKVLRDSLDLGQHSHTISAK